MKRSFRVVVLAVLALLLAGPVPNSLARPPTDPRLPVGRTAVIPKALDVGDAVPAAYGTGTVVHADALRTGEHALVDVDVAFSGAAFSQAPPPADYTNEVHRTVAKLLKDNKISYGRGTGLELGLGSDPVPLIGRLSEASAPASTDLIHTVVGPIAVDGLVRAELLRSQAQARAIQGGCPMGKDAGFGLGSVLNLELLGGLIATHASPPYREVSQSNSVTRVVKRADGRLGLKSETRQTIAPVTFFTGTPFQFTVEVLGEWALRAIAYGDESSIHYGPLDVSPQTPVVRILDAKGKPVIQVTTQMLLGKKGLEIKLPVAEIVIGEDPRMIGDDASSDPIASPTQVAAAADVVRVKALNGQLADVRIGHMEAAATVPAGGVKCPGLLVDQTVDKPTVTPGEEFTYVITITNPNDCAVTNLKLVETPTAPAGVKFEIVSTEPTGGSVADGVATYPDIGPLGPGETKTVKVTSKVKLDSAEGLLKALAVATGICPAEVQPANDTDGPATSGTPDTGDIPVRGEDAVDGPKVDVCVVPNVLGLPMAEAIKLITDAGCIAKPKDGGPGNPADKGKVIEQGTPPGASVPLGTPVEITIGGPGCHVPSVIGKTITEATSILKGAGCDLGNVTTGPDNPSGTPGTIQTQTPPAGGGALPAGTKVDVALVPGGNSILVAAGANCTVPGLVGMTEAEARSTVEAAGCVLVTEPKNTSKADDVGKVLTQEPGANTVVPRGSPVKVQLGVQVLGATETKAQREAAATGLARTGGVFLAGLSLWLLLGGVLARLAGSHRLWRLARRRG